jgi:hypothetical protein
MPCNSPGTEDEVTITVGLDSLILTTGHFATGEEFPPTMVVEGVLMDRLGQF